MDKNKNEKNEIVRRIRMLLPPSKRSLSIGRGMRTPMLSEVEEIDERSSKVINTLIKIHQTKTAIKIKGALAS